MGEPRKIIPFSQSGQVRPEANPAASRLDSWKEVAAYLRRGTRTVQRWEREQGLPVHRLQHDKLGSVYAFPSELDAWWSNRRADLENEPAAQQEAGPSIAVLPFRDLSREQDQEYFCEGIAEEISNALGGVEGLRVASRTLGSLYKAGSADFREVGRRLRVCTLLEGSVRKSGDRLRIAVRLTNADNGYQLWSETYERGIQDIFTVQEEIAQRTVQALEVTLSAREQSALGKVPTRNVHAYDYFLRGRKYYYAYGPADIDCAAKLFNRAIELDPNYALAYAGLADCWSYIYLYVNHSEEARQKAEQAGARAVELDPESAPAHASRAVALSISRRDSEAEAGFEAATRLDPNLFEAYYFHARHAFVRGQAEKAVRLYEQAMRVRPEDYQAPLLMAQVYDDLGRPEAAAAARQAGIERAERHLDLNPDAARALYMGANGLVALGESGRGREWVERAVASAARGSNAPLQRRLHLLHAGRPRGGHRLPGEGRCSRTRSEGLVRTRQQSGLLAAVPPLSGADRATGIAGSERIQPTTPRHTTPPCAKVRQYCFGALFHRDRVKFAPYIGYRNKGANQ